MPYLSVRIGPLEKSACLQMSVLRVKVLKLSCMIAGKSSAYSYKRLLLLILWAFSSTH